MTAGTPGQAASQPSPAFIRWNRLAGSDPSDDILTHAWSMMTGAAREFWAEVDAAPDARRALLDIIAELGGLDEPGPAADYIRMLAEYGLGEGHHPDGDAAEPELAVTLAPGEEPGDNLTEAQRQRYRQWLTEQGFTA